MNIKSDVFYIIVKVLWCEGEMEEDMTFGELDADSLDIEYIKQECNVFFGIDIKEKVNGNTTLGELVNIVERCVRNR